MNLNHDPVFSENLLRIGGRQVSPPLRNGVNAAIDSCKQYPCADCIVTLANANQLLSAKWMKWVRYPNKMSSSICSICILD